MAAHAVCRLWVGIGKQTRSSLMRNVVLAQVPCAALFGGETARVRCYATQKHHKLILEAQKRNRQRKLEKPKEKEKAHWLKQTANKLLLKPRRETWEGRIQTPPCDDVYNMEEYMPLVYGAADAVEMHKESHHPTILNDMNALLYGFVELNLSTKKKNKYRDNFAGTIIYPHEFEFSKREKRILALCKNTDIATEALEAGAEVAGGQSVIKRILIGELDTKGFDHILAHVDILTDLPQLRGLLKNKLPTGTNGMVSNDLKSLVASYLKGVDFSSNSDSHELDYGFLEVPVGKLSMPTSQLVENIKRLLETVETFKPRGTNPGTFITKVELKCPPTTEKFLIACGELLEDYVKADVDEVEKEEGDEEKVAEQAAA